MMMNALCLNKLYDNGDLCLCRARWKDVFTGAVKWVALADVCSLGW